jgi:hypothetical protein
MIFETDIFDFLPNLQSNRNNANACPNNKISTKPKIARLSGRFRINMIKIPGIARRIE